MKELIVQFFKDEEGLETIEMVILLVVIVGIAFAFRSTLTKWFNGFLTEATNQNSGFDAPKTGEAFSTEK